MKYIKKFESNEEEYNGPIPLRQPLYKKGEIIIWSSSKDINYDFAKVLLNRIGLKLVGEPYDGGYLVKCPDGKEVESAEKVIKRFPEFFDSYEREDIREPYINDKIEEIVDKVENIEDFFGKLDKKNVNIKSYNDYIDEIIKDLTDIKIK